MIRRQKCNLHGSGATADAFDKGKRLHVTQVTPFVSDLGLDVSRAFQVSLIQKAHPPNYFPNVCRPL